MKIHVQFNPYFVVLVVVLLAIYSHVRAQDVAPSVCRDTTYESGIRYIFHDLPDSWVSKDGFWYVAEDTLLDGHTLIADAVVTYPLDASGILPGEAVIGSMDYSITVKGTADTAPCNQPPESIPSTPQCPAWSFNTGTGKIECLWDLPPAPEHSS